MTRSAAPAAGAGTPGFRSGLLFDVTADYQTHRTPKRSPAAPRGGSSNPDALDIHHSDVVGCPVVEIIVPADMA